MLHVDINVRPINQHVCYESKLWNPTIFDCKCNEYTKNFAGNLVITYTDEILNDTTKTISASALSKNIYYLIFLLMLLPIIIIIIVCIYVPL